MSVFTDFRPIICKFSALTVGTTKVPTGMGKAHRDPSVERDQINRKKRRLPMLKGRGG